MIPTRTELLEKINSLKAEKEKLEKSLEDSLALARQLRESLGKNKESSDSAWAAYSKFYGQNSTTSK